MLSQGFPGVLREPEDLAARGLVQQGACLAGLAIENSMLGAAHALANPLTAAYGIVHGQAVGLMLPHVVTQNADRSDSARAAYEELAPGFAPFLTQTLAEAALSDRLETLGVAHDRLPQLAQHAAEQWTGTFNPVEMSADDYLRLYEAAF